MRSSAYGKKLRSIENGTPSAEPSPKELAHKLRLEKRQLIRAKIEQSRAKRGYKFRRRGGGGCGCGR